MNEPSKPLPKCGIYARVSTERQRERHTIGSQLRLLPEYANKQGWNIVEQYVDDGCSGETVEGRPEFSRLLDDATKDRFEILLVIDEDRISRSKSDMVGAFIYDTLRENNIKIATPSGTFVDLMNEDQDFFAALKREVAKWEKRKILSRMRRGRLEKWREGKLAMGKPPYGFTYDRQRGVFEIDGQLARVIRTIFELCVNKSLGLAAIANELNQRGIECPSTKQGTSHRRKSDLWAKSSVGKILHYDGYCGELAYNVRLTQQLNGKNKVLGRRPEAEWIRIPVPAILDQELFSAAQAKLRQRKLLADRNKKNQYLCGGLLHCAECGSKMCGEPSHGRTYYICHNRKRHHLSRTCPTPWLSTPALDQAVWSEIESIIKNPKVLENALAVAQAEQRGTNLGSKEELQEQLKAKDLEEGRALRLYTKGKLTEKRLDSILSEIEREREAIEARVALIKQESEMQQQIQRVGMSLRHFRTKIEGLSFKKKRDILTTFVDGTPGTGIFVNPDRSIRIVGSVPIPQQGSTPGSVQNNMMLWPPAIATSIARFACCCPRTSR